MNKSIARKAKVFGLNFQLKILFLEFAFLRLRVVHVSKILAISLYTHIYASVVTFWSLYLGVLISSKSYQLPWNTWRIKLMRLNMKRSMMNILRLSMQKRQLDIISFVGSRSSDLWWAALSKRRGSLSSGHSAVC